MLVTGFAHGLATDWQLPRLPTDRARWKLARLANDGERWRLVTDHGVLVPTSRRCDLGWTGEK